MHSSSADWARGVDAVADWIAEHERPGDVIAIDAPLIVVNESGMRQAERAVGRGYGRWKVGANASSRTLAARAAGQKTIRALVSPLIDTPDGKKEATAELVQQRRLS